MKKIPLIVSIFLSFGLSAQSVWHFGLTGGTNLEISHIKIVSSGNELTAASEWGYEGGGFAELSPGKEDNFFRIQMNILYSGVNVNYKMSSIGLGLKDGKINLHQINIPLLAKFYISDNLSINAGPSFNFNTGGKYSFTKADDTRFITKLTGKQLQAFQLGYTAGSTYYFLKKYFVDFKYAPLFGRINKEEKGDGSFENLNGKIKWGNISLSLGIKLW